MELTTGNVFLYVPHQFLQFLFQLSDKRFEKSIHSFSRRPDNVPNVDKKGGGGDSKPCNTVPNILPDTVFCFRNSHFRI